MALARSASLARRAAPARVGEFGMDAGEGERRGAPEGAVTKLEIMAIGTILCNNSTLFRCFSAGQPARCRGWAALSRRRAGARGKVLGLGGLPFSAGRFLGGVALFPVALSNEPGWGFSFWGDD